MLSQIKVMRGPNIWGERHQVYVIKINTYIFKNISPDELHEKLNKHFQLVSKTGSDRSKEFEMTLYFGEVCQLLQQMAGCKVQFFAARQKGNSFFSVFEYQDEAVGYEAAKIAEEIFLTLINGREYKHFIEDIARIRKIMDELDFGPSTSAIVNDAKMRGIPVRSIDDGRFIFLGHGKHQKKIEGTICESTGSVAVDLAGDKYITKLLLEQSMIPVPRGISAKNEKDLHIAIEKIGFPLVTKPVNGHQGLNVTTNITDKHQLSAGFRSAQEYSEEVIIEQFIEGNDYRFLVVNYKVVAVAERTPAHILGDGKSTVKQLIDTINSDPRRGEGHGHILTRIKIDDTTKRLLKEHGLSVDSVVPVGLKVLVKDTANLSTGGTAKDVTDEVHPENILLAERAARIIGLDICGIDIVTQSVSTPIRQNGGVVLEVNAAPGLRMHISPSEGKSHPVGKAIVDMMYPENSKGRIPIVAVTGTNGKTTTARLMAFISQLEGYNTGFTTTDGIYINTTQVERGDCTGPVSAGVVLHDPTVDFAVLECARGGILRSGLGFDYCDIGIVTNVAEDHLGLDDIYKIEEMAEVKSVVAKAVKLEGYAVLNASNDYTYKMKDDVICKIALFSSELNSSRIKEHCEEGGIACVLDEEKNIVLKTGNEEKIVMNVKDVPITMEGKADFMTENVLAVTLACFLQKFSLDSISAGLKAFKPDEHLSPGRLNMTDINSVHVMIDYAHNPHSLKAFSSLMKEIKGTKTGIITGVGDRRKEDIIEVGQLAAEMYDKIIIRIDEDTRGRSPEEIVYLLKNGIKTVSKDKPVEVIPEIKHALKHAVENSEPDSYVIVNVEKVFDAIDLVKDLKEEMEHQDQ